MSLHRPVYPWCTRLLSATFGLLGAVEPGAQSFDCWEDVSSGVSFAKVRDIADYDRDGDSDILWFHLDRVLIERNDGGSPFSPQVILETRVVDASAGDADGDGDLDVFFAELSSGADRVGWLENPGNLTSGAPWNAYEIEVRPSGSLGKDVTAADLDGDGDTDLFHNWSGDAVVYLRDSSPSGWSTLSLGDVTGTYFWPGDMDLDGDLDLFAGYMWLANNLSTGQPWTQTDLPLSFLVDTPPVDLDDDGDLDAVTYWAFPPSRTTWQENSDGAGSTWVEHEIWPSSLGWFFPDDIDTDGDLDLFCPSFGWLENMGSASSWTLNSAPTYPSLPVGELRTGDLNGDQFPDLVGTAWASPPLSMSLTYLPSAPAAEVTPYGCGLNPPGSLSILTGDPTLGTTMTLGIANPLGGHPAGSLSFLGISSAPDTAFPCGTVVPGLGMAPGADGATLIDPSQLGTAILAGPAYDGVNPVAIPVLIPDSASLAGARYYTQGGLVAPPGPGTAGVGVTDALEVQLGAVCSSL